MLKDYEQEELKTTVVDKVLIKRLFAYLHPYRKWVFMTIGTLVVAAAIDAWLPIRMGQMAQAVIGHGSSPAVEKREFFYTLLHMSAFVLGWIVLNYALDIFNMLIKNSIGQKAIFTLRTQVYTHMQQLPMTFYNHQAVGRLMTRTIHDVDQINQLLSESLIPLIGSFLLFVGILIGIFFVNWQIGLLFSLIFPLTWGFVQHFRHQQRRSYGALRSIVSAMNAFIQEHLMGVHVIRYFGLYDQERKKFATLNQDYYDANLDTVHHFSLFFSGTEFLRNLTLIAAFMILVYFSPGGFASQAGTYFTVSMYCLMIFRPLLDLAERYNVLQSAMAAAERVFAILDQPLEPKGAEPGLPLDEIQSIEFDNVWFAYEGTNWVLRGLSFKMLKGDSLALVGATGSGKTSVMNLLLRFHDLQKGRILINGEEIGVYSVASVRRQLGVILQDPVIFSGTIRENIAFYDPHISLAQIKASADFVSLTPIVARFPKQFEHQLLEGGGGLSVGEMQLIALARAMAHQRSVLLLDEATSNIDVQTEKIIQTSIKKMLGRQTTLVIAHRLSTIEDVAQIIVLDQGEAIEAGSHEQLLRARGVYEKLYRLQFSTEIGK